MRALLLASVALLLAAGCLAGPVDEPPPDGALTLSAPVRVTDALAREPSIARTSAGTLFVAGYEFGDFERVGELYVPIPDLQAAPLLWRSDDDGATWGRVDMRATGEAAAGNADAHLAVAPDDTLYYTAMVYSSVGQAITVAASADDGVTWTWTVLSGQPLADRPWVAVGGDGHAHVIWNDGTVVHHASSSDRGATWAEGPFAHVRGGSGGLAVASDGTIAVRVIPASGSGYTQWPGEDGMAISTDGGATWAWRTVPGTRDYSGEREAWRWADPVVFDAVDALHAAWGEDDVLYLARSTDLGQTWSVSTVASGAGTVAYPHLAPGPSPGVVAATWFTWREGEPDPLAWIAQISEADTDAPRVRAASFTPATPGGTGGEYFEATFLADGRLAFATTIQPNLASRAGGGFEFRTAR